MRGERADGSKLHIYYPQQRGTKRLTERKRQRQDPPIIFRPFVSEFISVVVTISRR
jgi:hypothetical protein